MHRSLGLLNAAQSVQPVPSFLKDDHSRLGSLLVAAIDVAFQVARGDGLFAQQIGLSAGFLV